VCRLLNRHRARYLLAGGGIAASLHRSVRATRDVDILIASKRTGRLADEADIEELKRILASRPAR
jgi:hypothetical protein